MIVDFAFGTNLLMLAAAMLLFVGGLALIASGNRMRDELVGRRIALIEPHRLRDKEAAAAPFEDYLVRLPLSGLSVAAQREVIRRVARLGVRANRALLFFVLARFAVVCLLALVVYVWSRTVPAFQVKPLLQFAVPAMAGIIGWFVPLFLIDRSVKQRIKAVRSGLPDALELLVVCVEAGLSLEDGLDRVVTELSRSQPALADELGLTLADLRILPSRDQALTNLAERVDVPSVRSVVTTLAQTLRYGTPLVQSLRVVAAEMRNDYLVELEERANRLPAYMTLPVIVFLMPTIFLIVGGPAALRLLDVFHH